MSGNLIHLFRTGEEVLMSAAVSVTRMELTAQDLHIASSKTKDAKAARRMLSITLVLKEMDRKTAAESGGMDRQTLWDWVLRYNSEGFDGLTDRQDCGAASRSWTRGRRRAWRNGYATASIRKKDGVVRWHCVVLQKRIEKEFKVIMHERMVGKQLAGSGSV